MRLITLLITSILAGAEVDLFVPSFPEIQKHFSLTPAYTMLIMGVNFIGYCIGSLYMGALGDKYGRKPVVIYSMLIFVLGSGFCVFVNNFELLLLGRFLQGIGIAGPQVLCYVIIADLYSNDDQHKIMGWMNGVVAMAMGFGPVIGSFVNRDLGWRGNFAVLLVLGIFTSLMLVKWIPNTGKKEGNSEPISLWSYWPIITAPKALCYVMAICFLVAPYWTFVGIAPLLYMDDMGVSIEMFGLYQGILALCFGVVSFTIGFWFKLIGKNNAFIMGCVVCATSSFAILVVSLCDYMTPNLITGMMLILSFGVVFPMTIIYPSALESFVDNKGKMAAFMTSSRLIVTSICLELVGHYYDNSFKPISIVIFVLLCISLFATAILYKKYDLRSFMSPSK